MRMIPIAFLSMLPMLSWTACAQEARGSDAAAKQGQDPVPGDGTCGVGAGSCTLRAAIQESNALAGPDTIDATPLAGTIDISASGSGWSTRWSGLIERCEVFAC